ncbi:MAG: adenosylcobinamide-GDP ribazoletransferase [Alphaproteobacteria bacterium]|nr:adenosylcobinamide-GDP ribazoletransferase [Alphaproteobacteria bacterium]
MELVREFLAAFGFLTRVPVWRLIGGEEPPSLARSLWAYPIVGASVGACGGGIAWIGLLAGMSPLLAAALAVGAMVLITGALHEDGLADTADGFGGGASRDRKLEIMRDSRIGTYGTVALVLSILVRCAAIAALADPQLIVVSLVVAGALARGFLAPMLQWMPSARSDGLGAQAAKPGLARCIVSMLLAIGATLALGSVIAGVGVILAASLAGLIAALLALRQIGGQTGDVMAAAEQAIECAVLVTLVAFKSALIVAL